MIQSSSSNGEIGDVMRYLGNKDSILNEINAFIKEVNIPEGSVFFDAFSGTSSVGSFFKEKYQIIANDYLYFSFVYSHAKLNSANVDFKKLNVDPFIEFNRDDIGIVGFITENYSPYNQCKRMYFSVENAKKIDYIRSKIEEWKREQMISDDEYFFLGASLLESISKVANIAGVYGAYLKKWDPRAIKPMTFIQIEHTRSQKCRNVVYNKKLEDIIDDVECDILYLDPPYTKNQYSVQYHLLETIAKYDSPRIKGITGARESIDSTSDWSREGKVEILLDKIVSKTKAKHIILSYSTSGIMSKEYIESVLKRYGKEETLRFKKIPYKKYRNHQTKDEDEHFEYLFYVEKKSEDDVVYTSPLNYMGGKSKMIPFLKRNEPKEYKKFIDIFGGGFNVGINTSCKHVVYNDINFRVKQLIEMFGNVDTFDLYKYILKEIKRYNLTKNNKESYLKARSDYNHPEPPLRDSKLLYVLVLFGFQQQIRFNSSLEFNNPVGESGFNDKIMEKMISFSRRLNEKSIIFHSNDFEFFRDQIDSDTFVYCDPPYLITLGSYNDGKRGFNGWNEKEEKRLLSFLKEIDEKGGKFMLSNVLTHKGRENTLLLEWIKKNNFRVVEFNKESKIRKEIIVLNY